MCGWQSTFWTRVFAGLTTVDLSAGFARFVVCLIGFHFKIPPELNISDRRHNSDSLPIHHSRCTLATVRATHPSCHCGFRLSSAAGMAIGSFQGGGTTVFGGIGLGLPDLKTIKSEIGIEPVPQSWPLCHLQ